MVWKNRAKFFHCVEKSAWIFHGVESFFPQCGKKERNFSTAWKIPPARVELFSTVWKTEMSQEPLP